jgi:hypothetical protein
MAAAPNALQPIAWECGNCAHTNEGIEPGPCEGCGAVEPIRYLIWRRPGGDHAPTAISGRVNRPLQVALSTAAFLRQPVPVPQITRRADIVTSLIGSIVDVVGIRASNRGRSCPRHDCCGIQVEPGVKVKVIKERMKYRGDEEDDVLAVYLLNVGGVVGCKVGFLSQALASRRADDYDGLVIRVLEVYSERCTSVVKRNKMHRNDGCAMGKILGDRKCLEIS